MIAAFRIRFCRLTLELTDFSYVTKKKKWKPEIESSFLIGIAMGRPAEVVPVGRGGRDVANFLGRDKENFQLKIGILGFEY